MSEWLETTLGMAADIRVSNVDKKVIAGERSVRLCNYMDVYSTNSVTADRNLMHATASEAEIQHFKLMPGDVVITKDSESPDDIAVPSYIAPGIGTDVVCGYHLAMLRPKNGLNGHFLSYLLRLPEVNSHFSRAATGSTRYGLSLKALHGAPLRIPKDEAEQRGIAEVLSALDEQIDATENEIKKLTLQRKGLTADLLSCTSLSFCDFEDIRLSEVIPAVQYGISSSLAETGAVPVLRMNNLSGGEVDVSDLKYSPLSVTSELELNPDDVLFNRTNSMEHVGRTSIWRGQLEKCTFASYLVRLSPDKKRILPAYLVYLLEWENNQAQMRKYATPGVQQVNINPNSLRRCRVRIPNSINAQRETVSVLDAAREHIDALKAEGLKLRIQKQGLMKDLLTGAVRV